MDINYITELGGYLATLINQRQLDLNDKHTVNYDHLFEAIYRFAMETDRKDGKEPGNKPMAFKIACEKLIRILEEEHPSLKG